MDDHAIFQVSLKVIMKNNQGKILILKNINSSSMPGFYDFPGGRISESEISEDFATNMDREIKEEIGSELEYKINNKPVSSSIHNYYSKTHGKTIHVLWLFFEAEFVKGDIKISDEHLEYKWIKLSADNINKYFTGGPLEGVKIYLSL